MLVSALAALGAAGWALAGHTVAQASTSVVLQVSGGGNATTASFTTGSDWALHFTYACPDSGVFRVIEQGGVQNGVPLVDTSGPSGQAETYSANAAGQHRLVVSTPCQWTLTAVDGEQMPSA